MAQTIILYALGVVVSILLGINIGKRKGFADGWIVGNNDANKFWKENLPKDVYRSVITASAKKLFDAINNSDSE